MGNSVDSRVNLLAKNWVQIDASTYKNNITNELIDAHQLYARNEEELSYNNSLLIKRAAINNPNVVKLIYFYEQQQNLAVCNNKKYKHRIYTEHSSGTLSSLMGTSERDKSSCYCCAVINGIGCLVQKYGYFGVSSNMVFFVSSVGLSKTDEKKIAKVWINQDIRINHTQLICNQQQMCFHLFRLYQLLLQQDFCNKIDLRDLRALTQFTDFFQRVYNMHKKVPLSTQFQRKRMTSQLNSFQASRMQRNVGFARQTNNTSILNIKKTDTNSYKQSLLHRFDAGFDNLVQTAKQSKLRQQHQAVHPRMTSMANCQQFVHNIFQKGEKSIKEVDLQQNSSQKLSKNKINFSYNDGSATPKQNKSFQQVNTTTFNDSPLQKIISVNERSISNKKQNQIRESQTNKRKTLPFVSLFNYHTTPQMSQTTNHFGYSSPAKNQQISQQPQYLQGQSFQQKKVETKEQKVDQKPPQQPLIVPTTVGLSVDEFKVGNGKKQANLKLQKCVDMQCNIPVQISSKSIGSNRQKAIGTFGIVNEYRMSFEPAVRIPSLHIDQSEQSRESIQISSGQDFRDKRQPHTSKFYTDSHPQVSSSVQSQKFTFDSNYLVPPALRAGYTRKGSLPVHQQNLDTKYHTYAQKLDELSKGITNSINSIHSNGTTPANSQEMEEIPNIYMTHDNRQLFTKAAKRGDYSAVNNMHVAHYSKREAANKRQSDIDSYYSESESLDQRKKAEILQKINNTQKILEQNKKKLEKLQQEKDLEQEKDMIKKQMETLLKNNLMVDESHRIKEKVKHKKATFAELKAEASKILNDLGL